jgi:hypothetical protein
LSRSKGVGVSRTMKRRGSYPRDPMAARKGLVDDATLPRKVPQGV